jgi:hypothetical protein
MDPDTVCCLCQFQAASTSTLEAHIEAAHSDLFTVIEVGHSAAQVLIEL